MRKEIAILDKIEGIDDYFNQKHKYETVIEIEKTDDSDIRTLNLKNGSWNGKEPWFIIDENQKLHTMVSIDTMHKLVENFTKLQKENFDLKLEKTILQHIPIDYQDVLSVVMDEIKKQALKDEGVKSLNINLEKLLAKIKKEYPNLFLNLKDIFANQNMMR